MIDARIIRRRARITIFLCIIAVIALTARRYLPAPFSATASIPSAFGGDRAVEELRRFVADGTSRAVATAGHDAALQRLRDRLSELGVSFTEQKFFARGWNRTAVEMTNILVRVPGESSEHRPPFVLLSAHYDSVPAGSGAGDNGAGVACAFEIIRALIASPAKNDVLALFTDGEETGLCGARSFALENPSWEFVGATVNLDARGSDGPVYIFETGADGPAHAAMLASLNVPARTTSLAAEAYRRMPNGTDFSVYLRGGRPGFNLAFIGTPRNYHTSQDTIANLDARTMNQMGTSALALVRALSSGQSPMPTVADFARWTAKTTNQDIRSAVWFDVFGFFIVHWPSWLSGCLVIASIVTLLISLRSLRRTSTATLVGSIIGCVDVLVGIVIAIVVGTLASLAMDRSGEVELPWTIASIWWADASLLLIGAIAVLIPSRLVARHRIKRRDSSCVSWDAWLGGWIVIAFLAGVLAWFAPGAVHPLLIPLVIAVIAMIVARIRKWAMPDWCACAAGIAALIVWAPLEPTFADAFGLSLGGFTALRGALIMIAMRPLGDPTV